MEHPPVTVGIDLANTISSDAWEEFFRLCKEYARIARERRAARIEEAQATPPTQQESGSQTSVTMRLQKIRESNP